LLRTVCAAPVALDNAALSGEEGSGLGLLVVSREHAVLQFCEKPPKVGGKGHLRGASLGGELWGRSLGCYQRLGGAPFSPLKQPLTAPKVFAEAMRGRSVGATPTKPLVASMGLYVFNDPT
jgi:hypothetical protein